MFEAALATERDSSGDRRFDTRGVGYIKLRIRVEHETGGVGKHWSQEAKTEMKTGS